MTSTSGIPRPFSVTDAKRAREEESRRRERSTSARNTSSTTVGAGGRIDIDGGDLTILNGGNAAVRDGGRFLVEGGGSMDITDDGQINVIGQGRDLTTSDPVEVRASLANRVHYNSWVEQDILQAGLYFGLSESRGDRDPRVSSEDGLNIVTASAVEPLQYGPQVGPDMVSESGMVIRPGGASMGTSTWDDALNPGGGGGLIGQKGYSNISFRPHDFSMWLGSQTGGTPEVPDGLSASIDATLEEGVLRLYGRNGVDVTGGFTVDGLPVGGAVSSVAGRTGAVVLAKDDVGLGDVDNTSDTDKPVSTAMQTALDGKASTASATTTTPGLMSAADKIKLDGSATRISHYTCTGSKPDFGAANQAISTPTYQSGSSTDDLGTPATGQITITEEGIYSIAYSLGLFTDAGMGTIKPATGRSFIDIADGAGAAYSRTPIPVAEDQATGNHAGLLLAAGSVIKFNVLQTSGGTAYYRARIWLTKHA